MVIMIRFHKGQHAKAPFPPTSSVYICSRQGNVNGRGKVESVLGKDFYGRTPKIVYKVQPFSDTEMKVLIDQELLRFQNGSKVKVLAKGDLKCSVPKCIKKKIRKNGTAIFTPNTASGVQVREGIVLGTCKIPFSDERYDDTNPLKNFWYSIQLMGILNNDGRSYGSTIVHEIYPDDVSFLHKQASTNTCQKVLPFVKKPSDAVKGQVLDIDFTIKKNGRVDCQLKKGGVKKEKQQSANKCKIDEKYHPTNHSIVEKEPGAKDSTTESLNKAILKNTEGYCVSTVSSPFSVNILEDGHAVRRGEVLNLIYDATGAKEVLFQVRTGHSTTFYSRDELRFLGGCKVKVHSPFIRNVPGKTEPIEGVVLGHCNVPVDDHRYDHTKKPKENFWYSVQLADKTIVHEIYPDDVSLFAFPTTSEKQVPIGSNIETYDDDKGCLSTGINVAGMNCFDSHIFEEFKEEAQERGSLKRKLYGHSGEYDDDLYSTGTMVADIDGSFDSSLVMEVKEETIEIGLRRKLAEESGEEGDTGMLFREVDQPPVLCVESIGLVPWQNENPLGPYELAV